jgi:hypothetical protein
MVIIIHLVKLGVLYREEHRMKIIAVFTQEPTTCPILSQMNPDWTFSSCLCRIYFDVTTCLRQGLRTYFFRQVAPLKQCVPFCCCIHLLYALPISLFLMWYPNNDFEDHKLWHSLLCTFLQSPVTSFLFGWIPSWTSSVYFFS